MTEYEILQYIKDVKDENGNAVFTPSNDTKLFKVDGQNIVMPCSFYRKVIVDGEEYFENFKVRAANHGGWFSRWEEDKELKPWLNKQNIDIVFAPFSATHSNLKANTFFVIQQYVYDSNEITIKKLKRIINAVLNIGKNDFSDPLGTARYRVLRPTNDKDELIPVPTDKSVNEYQIKVLREYEESENRHGTNESSMYRVQFDNIIYKTNMTHIKRLDEMAKSTVGTKRDRRITESRASRRGYRAINEMNGTNATAYTDRSHSVMVWTYDRIQPEELYKKYEEAVRSIEFQGEYMSLDAILAALQEFAEVTDSSVKILTPRWNENGSPECQVEINGERCMSFIITNNDENSKLLRKITSSVPNNLITIGEF